MKIPWLQQHFSQYEMKDALRLGVQAAVAAAAFYVLMESLGLPEKFVGVLSAVLVLEPSVGSTWVNSLKRFKATVVGCLIGVGCLYVMPDGYGTALALAVSMLVMNTLVGLKPEWKYGVVAAVALAIGSSESIWETSLDRSISIGIGVIVGALVSVVVWPDKSSQRVDRHLRWALEILADYLEVSLKQTRMQNEDTEEDEGISDFKNRYSSQISTARSCADAVRIADNSELLDKINHVDRLYHAVSILERISEESDQIDREGDDHFLEPVDEIKRLSLEVLQELSEVDTENSNSSGHLNHISEQLQEVREVVSKDEERESAHHTQRHALIFALNEIEDSLTGLVNVFK